MTWAYKLEKKSLQYQYKPRPCGKLVLYAISNYSRCTLVVSVLDRKSDNYGTCPKNFREKNRTTKVHLLQIAILQFRCKILSLIVGNNKFRYVKRLTLYLIKNLNISGKIGQLRYLPDFFSQKSDNLGWDK